MVDIVDAAFTLFPEVAATLFVDDLALEKSGAPDESVTTIAQMTKMIMGRIESDGMEVNKTKSLISASKPSLAAEVSTALFKSNLTISHRVKSLGVGLGAGTTRNMKVQNARLKNFRKRIPRFRILRRAGIDTAKIVRTGGLAALMHGLHTHGVSPSALLRNRRRTLVAAAPASGFGGQELETAMMIADGSARDKADPAFPAHSEVIGYGHRLHGIRGCHVASYSSASVMLPSGLLKPSRDGAWCTGLRRLWCAPCSE